MWRTPASKSPRSASSRPCFCLTTTLLLLLRPGRRRQFRREQEQQQRRAARDNEKARIITGTSLNNEELNTLLTGVSSSDCHRDKVSDYLSYTSAVPCASRNDDELNSRFAMNERDRRVVIQAALDRGERVSQIARMTGASRSTIRRVREQGVERAAPQVRRRVRTPALVEEVRQEILEDPRRSINAMAKDHGVSRGTMQTIIKKDLGLFSYARARGCLFNDQVMANRVELARGLINRLRHAPPGGDAGKVVIFSDERYFTVCPYHNRRNDQVIFGIFAFFGIILRILSFFAVYMGKG